MDELLLGGFLFMVGFGVSFDELAFGEGGFGTDEWDKVGYVDQYGRGRQRSGRRRCTRHRLRSC